MTALQPLTRSVLAFGLPGSLAAATRHAPDPSEWKAVRDEIARNGLSGLLASACQDGAVTLAPDQRDDLRTLQRSAATSALRIEAVALTVIERLETQGISVRLLKGLAGAHLDYPDPGWREFGDADLLVKAAHFEGAVAVLAADGHPRDMVERRPGFDRRFGKGVTIHGAEQVELDLHRTFTTGPLGLRLSGDDLWRDSASFVLGGRTVHALVPADRFLHACFAAVLGNKTPRLALLRDIAQLLLRDDLDATAVAERATRWGCVPVVRAAIAAATRMFGTLPPSPVLAWVAAARPSWRDRALLATYPAFGGSPIAALVAGVFVVPGVSGKLAYARALVQPSPAYLLARRKTSRRRVRPLLVDGLARLMRRLD
jgi:hypothetical protein